MAGDRGPWVVAVTWIFTAFATIAMALRLYVRRKLKVKLGWEDWIMLIAVVIRFASQIQISVSLQYGLGKHDKDLLPFELVEILKYNWLALPGALIVSTLARISITILLVKLFGDTNKLFKWFIISLTVLLSALSTALLFITFLQVTPTEALWNILMTGPVRYNLDPHVWAYLAYLVQSICTFTDLAFVLVPVMIIWRLNMSAQRKIGLIILMSLSLFTMAMSICKTIWIAAAANATSQSTDTQYTATFQVLFGVLEQDVVIIMGCAPTLAKLELPSGLQKLGQSLSSLIKRSTRRNSASTSHMDCSPDGDDLERSTVVLGSKPNDYHMGHYDANHAEVSAPAFYGENNSAASLCDSGNIKRTKQFTISYTR